MIRYEVFLSKNSNFRLETFAKKLFGDERKKSIEGNCSSVNRSDLGIIDIRRALLADCFEGRWITSIEILNRVYKGKTYAKHLPLEA